LCGHGVPIVAFLEFTHFQELAKVKKKDKQKALANDEVNRLHPFHEIPPWVKALEHVPTMLTNVGLRIRAKVWEAFDLQLVKWVVEILEWSINKDIFKGNASSPTQVHLARFNLNLGIVLKHFKF
jgi:hypothetical protein